MARNLSNASQVKLFRPDTLLAERLFDEEFSKLLSSLPEEKVIVLDVETEFEKLIGCGFYLPLNDVSIYLPLLTTLSKNVFGGFLKENEGKYTLIGHNIKYDLGTLIKEYGICFSNNVHDTMVLAWVLNSNRAVGLEGGLSLDGLCKYYGLQGKLKPFEEVDFSNIEAVAEYCRQDCLATYNLFKVLAEEIQKFDKLKKIYLLERKLIPVISQMEARGNLVDLAKLETFGKAVSKRLEEVEEKLLKLTGKKINFRSAKQVLTLLPEEITSQLPLSKTQVSAQKKWLLKFSENEIVRLLLKHRSLSSFLNTFYLGLKKNLVNGRLHTSYGFTRSGRYKSVSPNLQNIPADGEFSDLLRDSFIPSPQNCFIVVDFSQIELRCLAAIVGSKELLEVYNEKKEDLHYKTQSLLGVSRKVAKAVNFGIVYGQTAQGLAASLNISREEAQKLIDKFYEAYPAIKKTKEKSELIVSKNGYLETFFGRRRYFSQSLDKQRDMRSAFNFLCQGTAQDIFKIFLLYLLKNSQNLTPVLMVHDEIVFEVEKELSLFEARRIHKALNLNGIKALSSFPVKIEASIGIGHSWYAAKKNIVNF